MLYNVYVYYVFVNIYVSVIKIKKLKNPKKSASIKRNY